MACMTGIWKVFLSWTLVSSLFLSGSHPAACTTSVCFKWHNIVHWAIMAHFLSVYSSKAFKMFYRRRFRPVFHRWPPPITNCILKQICATWSPFYPHYLFPPGPLTVTDCIYTSFFVFWAWFGYKSLYLVMIHFGIGFKYFYFVYHLSAATFPLYFRRRIKGRKQYNIRKEAV